MGPACQLGKNEKGSGGLVYWAERGKGRLGLAQEARLGFSDQLGPRLVGPARFAGSGHGPTATSHSLSLIGWARGAVQCLPLTSGARPSVRRRIQCGRTGSGAAVGLCGHVSVC